jgi:hypothetical protein
MSHDGRLVRAAIGARVAGADRRTGVLATAGLGLTLAIAACGGTSSSGGVAGATGTPLASAETSAAASASAEASTGASSSNGLNQGFLVFQAQGGSGISGGGVITDLGDGSVAVTLGVVAVGFEDPLPARLVSGACTDAASAPPPSFAPPSAEPSGGAGAGASAAASTAPSAVASAEASGSTGSAAPSAQALPIDLRPVEAGGSNTVVQVQLTDLLGTPSSVLLYKSAADPTLVACADITQTLQIPSSAPGASAPAASAEASTPAASASTTP